MSAEKNEQLMLGNDQKDFKSQLPFFTLTRVTGRGLGVQCPRVGCGCKFIVNERKWREGPQVDEKHTQRFIGRPCPYCMRTSRIPS